MAFNPPSNNQQKIGSTEYSGHWEFFLGEDDPGLPGESKPPQSRKKRSGSWKPRKARNSKGRSR